MYVNHVDEKLIKALSLAFPIQYSTSFTEGAFIVVGLLNLLMPTAPAPIENVRAQPKYYLPSSVSLPYTNMLSIPGEITDSLLTVHHPSFSPFPPLVPRQSFKGVRYQLYGPFL